MQAAEHHRRRRRRGGRTRASASAFPRGARRRRRRRRRHARSRSGCDVAVAVGDFDSVTPAGLAAVEAAGAPDRAAPGGEGRDRSRARARRGGRAGAARIVVVGADGGRLDHLLAGLLLLGRERYAGVELDALLGDAAAHVVRGRAHARGRAGRARLAAAAARTGSRRRHGRARLPAARRDARPGSSRGSRTSSPSAERPITLDRRRARRASARTRPRGGRHETSPPSPPSLACLVAGDVRCGASRLDRGERTSCSSRTTRSRSRSRSRRRSSSRPG